MAKEAVFTMKLEPELREAFMAAARRDDRPASQLVREFMRDYVNQDRECMSSSFGGRLTRRGETLRPGVSTGHEEVKAHMDQLIADLERKRREAAE